MKKIIVTTLTAMTLAAAATANAEWKYKSTDEYKNWLNKINELCKQQVNPLEDREGFWDCLDRERERTPPPENHLEPTEPTEPTK